VTLAFLFEFGEMEPAEHAVQYAGLADDLESLLKRSVDLVEPGSIKNPCFRRYIEDTLVVLYAAA